MRSGSEEPSPRKLLIEIRSLIEEARQTATAINIGLTLFYRRGRRIHSEVLGAASAPPTANRLS